MAATQAPNANLNYGWDGDEQGINLQLDENWRAIDALLGSIAILSEVSAPPVSPANGDKHLIVATATGDFATHEGKVARYINSGEWELYTLGKGWQLLNLATGQRKHHNGTTWVLRSTLLTQYANDSAASSGGVAVGGEYISSVTGALQIRLT
jgi:hypothetical protein